MYILFPKSYQFEKKKLRNFSLVLFLDSFILVVKLIIRTAGIWVPQETDHFVFIEVKCAYICFHIFVIVIIHAGFAVCYFKLFICSHIFLLE